jgi:hypothetical protein
MGKSDALASGVNARPASNTKILVRTPVAIPTPSLIDIPCKRRRALTGQRFVHGEFPLASSDSVD